MTQADILQTLRQHLPQLQRQYPIAQIGLFGSYSRNEQTSSSDIDLVVHFSRAVGIEFIDLAFDLENILQHHVDLVSRNAIKPHYWQAIKQQIIYVEA